MFNNLYNAASEIRTLLMPFALVLCVIGIGEMGWRAGSDSRAILGALLKCIVIVSLIAGYADIMKGGESAFLELRNKFTKARDAKFVQLLRSTVQNQPSDAITDIGKIVPAAIGYFFQGIGRFMLLVLRFFQEFAIAGLIAVSPLLIGFLFFSYTQSVGVHFGVTSLTVLLWNVAICLVDITIQLISDALFLPITTGGLVQSAQNTIVVQNWLQFPFIMAFAAFLTVFFYLSVPFVASAVMKGLSATSASLQAGVHGTMQAAGLAVGTGLTMAGGAATFGGSAAARAALEGAQFAAGTASSAGRVANDFAGSVAGGSSEFGPGSELSADIPAPPPLTLAPVGERRTSESHPSLIAHQTTPNSFAVVDEARGTISSHRGNIFTPQVAQAAFNSHSSKAKPIESVPPPLPSSSSTPTGSADSQGDQSV
jgi:hypothetical protein